jgi:A/G-specific adenine glycosylase
MLQQTQVSRVVPKWEAFLASFPTVAVCAAAAQADVVRQWEGLGYHRRAVSLHRLAGAVMARFDGVFPSELADLQSLPGIGPYTARAVLAFAFEDDAAVVDTNVGRILARAVIGRRCGAAQAQRLADELAPTGDAWRWNQAMLDFGAMVCTKRSPRCDQCPITTVCAWSDTEFAESDPAVGSAAVSVGQSKFAGSDRQGRGRLLAALRHGPVDVSSIAVTMDWPDDPARAERVAATLLQDGLVRRQGELLVLA